MKNFTAGPFRNISQIEDANNASGGHWFEPDTLRFFRGRVEPEVYGGRFFVSSEQFEFRGEKKPRRWTVRAVADDGSVSTVGEFQAYATKAAAVKAARELVEKFGDD